MPIFITLILDHEVLMKLACNVPKVNDVLINNDYRREHPIYYK